MRLNKDDLPPTDGVWERNGMRWCSWLNGQLHNSLGPAIIYDDEEKAWYVNGKRQRLDGPAIECADGYKAWYINGRGISKQDFSSAVISFLLSIDRETAKLIEQEIEQ